MNSSGVYNNRSPLNILHLVASVSNESGGLGPVVLGFSKEQKRLGCRPTIWTLDNSAAAEKTALENELSVCEIRSFPTFGYRKLGLSPSMERAVPAKDGSKFDILHQHSLWLAISRVTNRWRKCYHRPTVLTPHGTLEEYALKRSTLKKKVALLAYEMANLRNASCLHATAISEAASFRNFGLRNPIAIIPNGIPEDELNKKGDETAFRSRYLIPENKSILLFLSRINPKKGLPLLFSVIKQMYKELEGWIVVIAGFEDVKGYQRELDLLVKKLNISDRIIFTGPLFGESKNDALAAASIFVLPTYSENFGIVVTEALAAGVPVLTTHGAPWEDLLTYNCGWWVEISDQGIYAALQNAIGKSKIELKEMGLRGKLLVKTKYTWPKATQMTLELYEWLLGRCSRPNFIIED